MRQRHKTINSDDVLTRLSQAGVDISSLDDVLIALESEIKHQRRVIHYMEHQLKEKNVTPSADIFEAGRLAGLQCLRNRVHRVGSQYISEGNDKGKVLCDMIVEIIDIEIERKT